MGRTSPQLLGIYAPIGGGTLDPGRQDERHPCRAWQAYEPLLPGEMSWQRTLLRHPATATLEAVLSVDWTTQCAHVADQGRISSDIAGRRFADSTSNLVRSQGGSSQRITGSGRMMASARHGYLETSYRPTPTNPSMD